MKLSIVTINYNNKEGLEKTIESMANQKSDDNYEFEYLVIDGLSSDGSCELIKDNSIITKYKIENDNGIADAFNKGIELANGEYLYFLNSGDVFFDDEAPLLNYFRLAYSAIPSERIPEGVARLAAVMRALKP